MSINNPVFIYRLPYPPSINRYWRYVSGRVLISKEGREYREKVNQAVNGAVNGKRLLLSGRLKVEIEAYMPDKRRRDLDNLNKALLDSITHAGVWVDDSQIDDLQIIRCADNNGGRLVLSVMEMNQ